MAICRRLCFSRNKAICNIYDGLWYDYPYLRNHENLIPFADSIISKLNFSTSYSISNKWRIQQGLERDPRQFGPLTNLPDYSFVDGRPTILSNRKMNKLKYQEDICRRIVQLTNEMDEGLQHYYEMEEQKIKTKEAILKGKLKEKGAKLLSKNNKSSNSET